MNTLLRSLPARHSWLAAPARCHPEAAGIRKRNEDWALTAGLAGRTTTGAAFADIASCAFAEFSATSAILFANWLTWLFCLDDEIDEGPTGRSPDAVDALYAQLRQVIRRDWGNLAGSSNPLITALAELWKGTSSRADEAWRQRFANHLDNQWRGARRETLDRYRKRIPGMAEYPAWRRRAVGTEMMFDLVEPLLSVAVPSVVFRTSEWTTLTEGANDVIAWCNDLASFPKERARGNVHNYVLVAAHARSLTDRQAAAWVRDRIVLRLDDMQRAVRAMPAQFTNLHLNRQRAGDTSLVAAVLMGAPRGHLDWLLTTHRYPAR